MSMTSFAKATLFESGYGAGFRQFEVRGLHICVVPLTGGGEYDAATFVERGKRKERVLPLQRLLILHGWDHPLLETLVPEPEVANGARVLRAKFHAFSPAWDTLLDDYLASNGLRDKIIVDGRNQPELAPRTPRVRREIRAAQPSPEPVRSALVPTADQTMSTPESSLSSAFTEGAVEAIQLDRFERDPRARAACLEHYGYRCRVCDILISDVYGFLGQDYIHVHHRVPLSDVRQEYIVDPVRDLIPVCPNCHTMLHRSTPPLSVEVLAEIVRRGAIAAQPDGASRRC